MPGPRNTTARATQDDQIALRVTGDRARMFRERMAAEPAAPLGPCRRARDDRSRIGTRARTRFAARAAVCIARARVARARAATRTCARIGTGPSIRPEKPPYHRGWIRLSSARTRTRGRYRHGDRSERPCRSPTSARSRQ